MKTEPKNQHYIPQSYLRNFSTNRKGNDYVNVRLKGEKFHETNIRNICSENYFYSIPEENDSTKNLIERYYSENIDTLYPEITELAKNEKITQITDEQREKILYAVLNLYFRTPKFLAYYENHLNELEKIFDDHYLGTTERHTIEFFGKKIDFRQINYDDFKKNIKEKGKQLFLSQHIKLFKKFVDYKKNDGISVSKIEDDSEFITSDNPVIIRNAYGINENIFSPDNIIHFPITDKHMITITPKIEKTLIGSFLRISDTKDIVTGINHDIEKNSKTWIIGSKDGINNHLDNVDAIENDLQTGNEFAERNIEKAKISFELCQVFDKNNGMITQDVIDKLKEASQNEFMKDDPNLIRFLKYLNINE